MPDGVVVFCYPNGNTAVCLDGKQVPEAQEPWILSIAKNLEKCGLDPTTAEVNLPTGERAHFFRTSAGQISWLTL